jgi:hypothetical protein
MKLHVCCWIQNQIIENMYINYFLSIILGLVWHKFIINILFQLFPSQMKKCFFSNLKMTQKIDFFFIPIENFILKRNPIF